jgi:GrpB-like predicted nucleotidyltransferase (UPF0157 family)
MTTITPPISTTIIAMADAAALILEYPARMSPPRCLPWDPRSARAAARVIAAIEARLAEVTGIAVEHIGSTSVPCEGKGFVDLLIAYPEGALAKVKDALAALGFQRQRGRDPFPEDRPMRVGAVEEAGAVFPIHAHVVAASSPEAGDLRRFRDRLRADRALRDAYVAKKRAILARGVDDMIDYAIAKGDFVADALAEASREGNA